MYLKYTSPEQVGINLNDLKKFEKKIQIPENKMHNIAIMRGNYIFYEATAKYHKINEKHRMYSQTKSYEGLAIGILVDEGKIDINKPLSSYFPEYIDENTDPVLLKQTVAQTLQMTSSIDCEYWFTSKERDRVKLYFKQKHCKEAGSFFQYDSAGSQVLAALVEKISGMHLIDFLKERVFKYLDFFKGAYMLYTPDGRNWGDSGLICDLRANLSTARMYLNKGTYNGHRIVSEKWIELQTTKKVDNDGSFDCQKQGYCYQIWGIKDGYAFFGMGNQLTFIFPKKDMAVTLTSSCFNAYPYRNDILNAVYELVDSAKEYNSPIEGKPYKGVLTTYRVDGDYDISKYLDKEYVLEESSPVKSIKISKRFNHYVLEYLKDGSIKKMSFKTGDVIKTKIKEDGCSRMVGGVKDNMHYKCLGSAAIKDNKLLIFFEIMDIYLGFLSFEIDLSSNTPSITFKKDAEDYLWEFTGNYKIVK